MEKGTEKDPKQNPQIIFAWKAPMRAYKKRGKNVLRFYVALALVLSLIVFFFGDKILLVPIWALLFLFYVYTITPPPETEHRLMKFGLDSSSFTVRWEDLSHFYFIRRFGYDMVTIVPHQPYYTHIYLVLPDANTKKKVMEVLSQHLIFLEKPKRSITDKMIDVFMHLVPDGAEDEQTAEKESKKEKSKTKR